MTAKNEVLMTGDAHGGKFTKIEHSVELNLRTKPEKGTEENEISADLAQKLRSYGFVELDLLNGECLKKLGA